MDTRQVKVKAVTPSFWEVTFVNPTLDAETIPLLNGLLADIETEPKLTVVVFKSDAPDFFMAHHDNAGDTAALAAQPPGPGALHPWNDVLVRLWRLPVLTVASIRGRPWGAGSEFLRACDVRFASRENAIPGEWEVGTRAVPGGGPIAPLARFMGRRHGLEILVGEEDFPGDRAERSGFVNRAVPDSELDTFVETFARRIAGFEEEAITKPFIDDVTLPPLGELVEQQVGQE